MPRQAGTADLVLVGGSVVTMDAARSTATAIAVRDGKIVAVGTDRQAADLVGRHTRRVNLAGRTLLPGFQDAHCHPSMAGLNLTRCPLHELPRTPDAYLAAIAAYASANADRSWVLGDGWYMSAFPGATPTREELDRVVPDRPAFFVNRDGHGAWVNTRALAAAGITR
ncbi:MAG TPA: amidohydrolase family protein, partial [Candidatus Sulfomarinibacteraceae bacterium]|nr:amidohydrolase family protein [Candidatus Sulfomarinibacteraceae bacterium]